MTSYINPHFINASRLIMLSAIVSIVGFILLGDFTRPDNLYFMAAEIIIVIGLAFFIRKQHNWAKWLFLLVTLHSIYSFLGMLFMMNILLPLAGFAGYAVAGVCTCLYITASVLLMLKPTQDTAELAQADTTGPFDALDE